MPEKGEKMEKENALNKAERTTIRTDMTTRERIKKLAQQRGMTQEKFLEWMVDQAETGIPKSVDRSIKDEDRYTSNVDRKPSDVDHNSGSVDINNYDLLLEIKAVKKVVYRMIKELCRITDTDVNDPDSGITMRAKYDDQLQHPEKYRRRYTSTFVKGK